MGRWRGGAVGCVGLWGGGRERAGEGGRGRREPRGETTLRQRARTSAKLRRDRAQDRGERRAGGVCARKAKMSLKDHGSVASVEEALATYEGTLLRGKVRAGQWMGGG